MTARSVVVYGHNGILSAFCQSPYGIVHPLLHFRIGTLHSIHFHGMVHLSRSHRRSGSSSHPYSVIVTSQQDYLISFFRHSLMGIFQAGKTNASGLHDDFVIPQVIRPLNVFKTQERTANKRMTKFVTVRRCPVRSTCKNLFRAVIRPLFCNRPTLQSTGIRRHINGRSGYGERSFSTGHAVSDFTARSGGRSVERLYRSRKIMCFRFQTQDRMVRYRSIKRRFAPFFRDKKRKVSRSPHKRTIVFVSRHNAVGIQGRCFLNQIKERMRLLYSVNDERTVKNLVATMLGIYL